MLSAQTAPDWWEDTAYQVTNGNTRADSAIATIGQAKHVVKQAYLYLETELGEYGVGSELNSLYAQFCVSAPSNPDSDKYVLTIGQLKYLAKPFYDRLNAADVSYDTASMNPEDGIYPWSDAQTDDNDLAPATIGQLKYCFSFDLSTWALSSWDAYRGHLVSLFENDGYDGIEDILAEGDFDGDGVSNYDEFINGTHSDVFFANATPEIQLSANTDFIMRKEMLLSEPLNLLLTDSGQPMVNKPVKIEVISGEGYVYTGSYAGAGLTSAVLWTDGIGNAYFDFQSGSSDAVTEIRISIAEDNLYESDSYVIRILNSSPTTAIAGGDSGMFSSSVSVPYRSGRNEFGQAAISASASVDTPTQPVAPNDVSLVFYSLGNRHAVGMSNTGVLQAWGANDLGQLGNSSALSGSGGALVVVPWSGQSVVQISSGQDHNLVLLDDGTVWAWGLNSRGQAGVDPLLSTIVWEPQQVNLPVAISQVVAGANHNLALGTDGRIFAWGDNRYGQLGTTTNASTTYMPLEVSLPNSILAVSVSAGRNHSVACLEGGSLASWGANKSGQLGLVGDMVEIQPAVISGISQVVDVACGDFFTAAIVESGEVYAWGANWDQQLGELSQTGNSHAPGLINTNGVDALSLSLGRDHGYFVGSDGNVYGWGSDRYGQAGTDDLTPILLTLNTP